LVIIRLIAKQMFHLVFTRLNHLTAKIYDPKRTMLIARQMPPVPASRRVIRSPILCSKEVENLPKKKMLIHKIPQLQWLLLAQT
jgi:hypothetical protein